MNDKTKDRLSQSLFQIVLVALMGLSLLSIAGNLIFGFPLHVNIKWMLLIVFAGWALLHSKNDQHIYFWKVLFFVVITYIVIPLGWFDSGGSENLSLAYVFLLIICTTFFFWGKTRLVLIISQIGMIIALLIVEYLYPDIVSQYDSTSHFYDRLFQIPLTLLAGFLFLRIFANAYNEERIRLNHLVQFDPLTNLYNRRSFDITLKKTLETVKQEAQEVYLLFLDVDDFKQINDDKGHTFGDQVLTELADYTKQLVSDQGIVARWGGDEFAVIFKGPEKALFELLKKIHLFKFSLSIGVVKISNNDQSIDALFKRADRALYQAKNEGKNRYYFDKENCALDKRLDKSFL